MAGKKLAGVTADRMKNAESERKASGLAEKGASALTSVDSQFKKMTKVLSELNKNVDTLKTVEMVQLAGDHSTRKKAAAYQKETDIEKKLAATAAQEYREKTDKATTDPV